MATLVKAQALRSSGFAHATRAPVRCSMGRRQMKPVQATIAFVETEVATDKSTRAETQQRIQEVQAVIAMKVKEAAVEAPARRIARDRLLMAACIKAAALQDILAASIM